MGVRGREQGGKRAAEGGVLAVSQAREQGEGEAGGGSRRWSSGARASTRLCLLAEVEDGGASGGLGQLAGLPSGLHGQ